MLPTRSAIQSFILCSIYCSVLLGRMASLKTHGDETSCSLFPFWRDQRYALDIFKRFLIIDAFQSSYPLFRVGRCRSPQCVCHTQLQKIEFRSKFIHPSFTIDNKICIPLLLFPLMLRHNAMNSFSFGSFFANHKSAHDNDAASQVSPRHTSTEIFESFLAISSAPLSIAPNYATTFSLLIISTLWRRKTRA